MVFVPYNEFNACTTASAQNMGELEASKDDGRGKENKSPLVLLQRVYICSCTFNASKRTFPSSSKRKPFFRHVVARC